MSFESNPNKRIAKNTLYLYLRSIFLLCISLYTSRLILSALGIDNYGIYNVVGGVVAMFTVLSNAMASASQRYITYSLGNPDKEEIHRVFQTCVNLHYVIAILMVLILEIVGIWFVNGYINVPEGRMTATNYVLQFSILSLFIEITCVPYTALIVAHEHMKAFAYISIFEAIEKLAMVFLLMYIDADRLILYAMFMFACVLIKRLIFGVYSNRCFEESRHLRARIDKSLFKEMASFSGWNLFGQGSYLLRNQGIDILLNMFFGVTVNAAKGVCNQVQSAVAQFVSNFQSAIYPQITISLAQTNYERVYSLIITGSKISFYLLSIMVIPLALNLTEVLELWLVEVPEYTVSFIRLTFIFMLMDSLSRFLIHGIDSTGKIKNYQLVVGTTKLFALPLTYIFLLLGGDPMTGLIVNIALEVFCLGERLYFCRKQLYLPIFLFLYQVLIRCAIVFTIAFSFSYMVYAFTNIYFIIKILVIVVIVLFTVLLMGFNVKERALLKTFIAPLAAKFLK